jgi:hypothetical protein
MSNKHHDDKFWRIVEDSLVELHGMPAAKARARVASFRRETDSLESEQERDMLYHTEPFDVACALAKHELDFLAYRDAYRAIRDRYRKKPSIVAPE